MNFYTDKHEGSVHIPYNAQKTKKKEKNYLFFFFFESLIRASICLNRSIVELT